VAEEKANKADINALSSVFGGKLDIKE